MGYLLARACDYVREHPRLDRSILAAAFGLALFLSVLVAVSTIGAKAAG